MIEAIMYFGMGVLLATLVAVALIPFVHGRAVRLTTRRLEDSIPQSMAEIQADKDALRAEFAMSTRRLEITIDELKNRETNQLAELGKNRDAVNRLKIEREAQKVEVAALKAELDTLKDRLTAADKVIERERGRRHAGDLISLASKEWPSGEETRVAREESDVSARSQVTIPSIHVSPRTFSNQFVSNGPPIGRRILRGLSHFSIVALIGAGVAFAWQSRGDDAKEMVRTWLPSIGRLLSVPATKGPPDVLAKRPDSTATQDAVSSQSAPVTQTQIIPATPTLPEVAQEPENAPEGDLAGAQHSEEQLAPGQEQTAENIATLKSQQDTKQETPSPAPQHQPTPAPAPETGPTTIASWTVREVTNSTAVLQGPAGTWRVTLGDTVPGLGKVTSIVRWGDGWVVATSAGYCTSTPRDHADGNCKPYRRD
ncbi:MAG TPA: hypothetical protein VGQ63_00895 [Pseudolabrys sp.]|jgi:hypothetical protein|nr:hypothetical protein [Pseudolabrys sp.]